MAMDFNKVNLETQEQLMEEAKAKAQARRDAQILAAQEEEIKRLLAAQAGADAGAYRAMVEAAAKNMAGYKPNEVDPDEAAGEASSFNAEDAMKRVAARDVHGKPINPSGTVAYGSMTTDVPTFNGNQNPTSEQVAGKYKTGIVSKDSNPRGGRPMEDASVKAAMERDLPSFVYESMEGKSLPTPEQKTMEAKAKAAELTGTAPEDDLPFPVKTVLPSVDEALKAIADKDPSMLQLPEVKELLKRSRAGYDKQRALSTVAAFTSNPQMWMQQANAFREQGDKNLMDAADNLEKLRDRKLLATKAVADNLAAQKSTFASLYGSVYNTVTNGMMQLPSIYEAAREANAEADRIHEVGDQNLKAARGSLDMFLQGAEALIDNTRNKKEALSLLNEIRNDRATNGSDQMAWYDTVGKDGKNKEGFLSKLGKLEKYILQNKLPEYLSQVKAMTDNVANYKAAMASEEQARQRAQAAYKRGDQMFNIYSNLAMKHRIPLEGLYQPTANEGNNEGSGETMTGEGQVRTPTGVDSGIPVDQAATETEVKPGKKGKKGNPGGKTDEEEETKTEPIKESNGGLVMYKKATDALSKLRNSKVTALDINNAMSETSGTLANYGDRAKAKIMVDAQNELTSLLEASMTNPVAASVLKKLLNSKYVQEVDALLPDGSFGRAKAGIRAMKNLPELSMRGDEALRRQNEILSKLSPVALGYLV